MYLHIAKIVRKAEKCSLIRIVRSVVQSKWLEYLPFDTVLDKNLFFTASTRFNYVIEFLDESHHNVSSRFVWNVPEFFKPHNACGLFVTVPVILRPTIASVNRERKTTYYWHVYHAKKCRKSSISVLFNVEYNNGV